MKKTICVALFALLGLLLAAQTTEDYHFYAEDGRIFWRQVFESPADSTTLLDHIFGSGIFVDIAEISSGISVVLPPQRVDIRAAGLKAGSVSMYILNYTFTAHALLEMKEGRYRVTVDRIMIQSQPELPLESYALNRRGEFKPIFVSMNAAQALDHELTRLFTVRMSEKEEDW